MLCFSVGVVISSYIKDLRDIMQMRDDLKLYMRTNYTVYPDVFGLLTEPVVT